MGCHRLLHLNIYVYVFSVPFSLSSPSGTLITHILDILILFHRSLTLCHLFPFWSVFFLSHSLLSIDMSSSSCSLPLDLHLTIKPTPELFLFQIFSSKFPFGSLLYFLFFFLLWFPICSFIINVLSLYILEYSYTSCFKCPCLIIPASQSFWDWPPFCFPLENGSCFPGSLYTENFRLYPEYFEGCIEETLNSTLSFRKLLIFSLSR